MTKIIERREVRYFEAEDARCPYVEWRDELDVRTQAILAARISRLEAGNPGHVESLGDGLRELKIDVGPGYRIYFGNAHGQLVIVLAGGSKRHQSKDIAEAKVFWKDWKVRNESKPSKSKR